MQQQVYQVHDVDELKEHLIDVWHGFEQSVINMSGFIQVRENWKRSGNLSGQGKSGKMQK